MASKRVYCVVDVGGTKILSLLIDSEMQILHRERILTPVRKGAKGIVDEIIGAVDRILKRVEYPVEFAGLGLCIAGLISYPRGEVFYSPNLNWQVKTPLKEILASRWPVPVLVENDANAAAVGEATYGAAQGYSNVIYITISTGIGGGLYLNNRIYRGGRGFAGEVGHVKYPGYDYPCGCGKVGCLETLSSGSAIARIGKEAVDFPAGDKVTTSQIFGKADRGDPGARSVIDAAWDSLGLALANLATLLDLDAIVVGGGVTAAGVKHLAELRSRMIQLSSNPAAGEIPILKAQLEPDSGVWGMFSLLNSHN